MSKLILQCGLATGDIVMLTAAVRDLHRCYPQRFLTDVRTPCPELWEHNPHITPLADDDPEAETIACSYPLIDHCNERPYHCLHGFIEFLNGRLGLSIKPTAFKGDVHLSEQEKAWYSQVRELTSGDAPFWIIAAGGKYDITVKWWESGRYQEVVNHFRDKIQFVQVGRHGHCHPKLEGVIDLRGRTSLRELIRLVYHSQGVLCSVTALMHLAAAVETRRGQPASRACVVVAGGREPAHWEAYPDHQFVHTNGALPCCIGGGCWKDRTARLRDGDKRDRRERLCVNVAGSLPRCMDLITPAEVVRRIALYFQGGACKYLSASQRGAVARGVAATARNPYDQQPLNLHNAGMACERFIPTLEAWSASGYHHRAGARTFLSAAAFKGLHGLESRRTVAAIGACCGQECPRSGGGVEIRPEACPDRYEGRGIVICGGGVRYFTNAWVCVQMLRRLGCALPIQLWHLGAKEMDGRMQALVAPLGVECVDAFKSRKKYPVRRLHGWELKPYAILHCRFREVLFLDADNVPVVNPEFLFDTPRYQASGAIFWPDYEAGKNEKLTAIWRSCGMRQPDEPEFETGQIVVDKRRCWRALRLSLWFNEHSDFYYRYLHGDKETFHLAFRKLKQSYALVPTPIHRLEGTMCQHDFDGRRIFQHRNTDKWDLFLHNKRVGDFWFEQECRHYVRQLRRAWDGGMGPYAKNGSKTLPFPKRSLGWLKLEAVMISCAERSESRQQTLANLAKTDWDGVPLHVQVHESKAEEDWQAVCAYLALKKALEGRADYILFLEDDLDFNRHIRRNLERWAPVQAKQVTLASLYNPRVRESACDLRNNARIVEPGHVFGSKAFLISQETVRHIVRHWTRVEGGQDIKIARLAGRLRRPIFYHAPSLVQHIKTGEAPEPRFQQAMDFDPDWAA